MSIHSSKSNLFFHTLKREENKMYKNIFFTLFFITVIFADWNTVEKVYYKLEINETLVGHLSIDITKENFEIVVNSSVLARLNLVGGLFDYRYTEKVKLDEKNKPYFYRNSLEKDNIKTSSIIYITEDSARIISKPKGGLKSIKFSENIFFEVYPYYTFLKNFGQKKSKSYAIFNELDKKINHVTYEKMGSERLFLGRKSYQTTKFRRINESEEGFLWIHTPTGLVVKSKSGGNLISLSTKNIINKVNKIPNVVKLLQLKPLDAKRWQDDKVYKYRYLSSGKDLGSNTFNIHVDKETGVYFGNAKLKIGNFKRETKWQIKKNFMPQSYEEKGEKKETKYSLQYQFFRDYISQKMLKNAKSRSVTIPKKNNLYLFEKNNVSLLAMILSRVPLQEKIALSLDIFNPSSGRQDNLEIKIIAHEDIIYKEKTKKCWNLQLKTKNGFSNVWLDELGNLIRKKTGRLIIELE